MTKSTSRKLGLVGLCCATLFTWGCSGNLQDAIQKAVPTQAEYKSSKSLPPLEIPPGLSSDNVKDTMPVPEVGSGGGTTYSDYSNAVKGGAATRGTTVAVLPKVPNVKVERSGDKRWLLVAEPPEQVWPRVRQFLIQSGFTLKTEDPTIGIMETDWAENQDDVPKNFLTKYLGKVIPQLSSANTRDKYRIRLERGAKPGTTEVYVSHRGLETKVSNSVRDADYLGWVPRPPDPGLEAEMLNRLMVYLGVDEHKAHQLMASAADQTPRAQIVHDSNGAVALTLPDDFSQAWRRTGLALDRVGFTVEDRDRSRGLYYVRYVDPQKDAGAKDDGWLSKLKFWSSDDGKKPENDYLISLVEANSSTRVVVLNTKGERDTSSTADRILSLLHDQLK